MHTSTSGLLCQVVSRRCIALFMHARAQTHTDTHACPRSLDRSRALSLSRSRARARSLSLLLSLSHTRTHTNTLFVTQARQSSSYPGAAAMPVGSAEAATEISGGRVGWGGGVGRRERENTQ